MTVKNFIKTQYEAEEENLEESFSVPVTFRISGSYASVLQSIAERFGDSRSGFGAKLLHNAIEEAFASLRAEDREQIAIKADSVIEPGTANFWQTQAAAYAHIETIVNKEAA